MKHIMGILAAGCAGLCMTLSAAQAEAATYNVCLHLPVAIDDETGQSTETGVDGNWRARGMRIQYVKNPNGTQVAGFPKFADAATGCFTFTSSQSGNFELGIQPWGMLAGNNVLKVVGNDDPLFTYLGVLNITGTGGNYVWPSELINPRMYAVFAYAIQVGFRGNYDSEELVVHYESGPCSAVCDKSRMCSVGDVSHIQICDGSTRRKFTMGHEYGHANLRRSTSGSFANSCGYNGSGHGFRGLEYNSCAVMEGWANFMAAEIWNQRTPGATDQLGWVIYSAPGNPLVDVEAGHGGCAAAAGDATNFRQNYADNCFITGSLADPACSTGNCVGMGVELDWMRTWWDFYTDADLPGVPPTSSELHDTINASGGWGAQDAWQKLEDGITDPVVLQRFRAAANWNGASEP